MMESTEVILARMDERLKRMEGYLLGNGQPGKLAKLDERIDEQHQKLESLWREVNEEVTTLRSQIIRVSTAVGVLAAVIEFLAHNLQALKAILR